MNKITIFSLLTILVFSLVSGAFGVSYNIDEFVVSDGEVDSMSLEAKGDYVIFRDMSLMRLRGYQLSTRESFYILPIGSDAFSVRMNGEYVVWTDMNTSQLHGYYLDGREMFVISVEAVDSMSVVISDRYVFWKDMAGEGLYGFDMIARKEIVIEGVNADSYSIKAAGDYVVWYDSIAMALYGYDIVAEETFTVSDVDVDTMGLTMNREYVVWTDYNGALKGYDLSGREGFEVALENVDSMSVKLASNFVVWFDNINFNLLAFDLDTREPSVLSESDVDSMSVATSDRYVVWKDSMHFMLSGFDLQSGQVIDFNVRYDSYSRPAITGDYVIWEHNDPVGMTYSIVGFDIFEMEQFLVSDLSSGGGTYPVMASMGHAIWYDMIDALPVLKGGKIFKVVNDECVDAAEVFDDVVYAGDSTGALGEDLTGCGYNDWVDVWHEYRPTAGGEVTVDTNGSSFDTTVSVFNACGGDEIACNDDYSDDHTQSRVTFSVVKGKTYYIRVAGFDGQSGAYQLLVSRGVCREPIVSDLNGDCKVDLADLAIMSSEWLKCNLEPAVDCWN